jgi:hypothetical protein
MQPFTNTAYLGARLDVDCLNTSQNGGSELGAEGIPHTVLDLGLASLVRKTSEVIV